ncbi:hypothetical protein NPIL_668791 [Nephila pilipes]|uniref:Uncharacterized protein n=1 Tax=Nephila pilipes TaxID=299642 RepID=A0A8X6TQH5_NEPPI|nr:hypothetical protein NPIL_668791 [Nephila pilipes]
MASRNDCCSHESGTLKPFIFLSGIQPACKKRRKSCSKLLTSAAFKNTSLSSKTFTDYSSRHFMKQGELNILQSHQSKASQFSKKSTNDTSRGVINPGGVYPAQSIPEFHVGTQKTSKTE